MSIFFVPLKSRISPERNWVLFEDYRGQGMVVFIGVELKKAQHGVH